MTDVFLSYSRKDTIFVREIYEILITKKRESWIDLNDIDYSVKWWDEICAGIDGADNFVLCISPNSMGSLFCHREIQFALEHKKRIIPFLIKPVDQKEVFSDWENNPDFKNYEQTARENWELIQSIQWIDYTKINDINKTVDALLETVDTDPERTKLHTRLLLRLRGWESQGRNPSGLLRGDELIQYEKWFAGSKDAHTPPLPTDEQEIYIIESRRIEDETEAKRIQRERLVRGFRVASIALGVFFIMAVVAIFISIRREAQTNAQVAAGNTQIAIAGKTLTPIPPALTKVAQTIVAGNYMIESLNLAADAISILSSKEGNAETAALLGIRVLRKVYLEDADEALVEATIRLQSAPVVYRYEGVSGVDFSPDGKTFVVGISTMYEGRGELRDIESGVVLWRQELRTPTINSVSFSPDGKWIVAAMGDHTAALWDAESGEIIRVFVCENDLVEEAIFSPDGMTILTRGKGSDPRVRLFDIQTGEEIFSLSVDGWFIKFLQGGKIFAGGRNFYNVTNGTITRSSVIDGGAINISPDGTTSLKGLGPTAELHNINNGQMTHALVGHSGKVGAAVFSADGKFVVTGSEDNTARVWDTKNGTLIMTLSGHSSEIKWIAISPDATKVLTGANEEVRLWNITGDNQQKIIQNSSEIISMAISPDGRSVLVGDVEGSAKLWNLSTGELLKSFSQSNAETQTVAFSPNGKLVAIPSNSDFGGDVDLYDPDTGKLIRKLSVAGEEPIHINHVSFSADSSMVFAHSRLWDVSSGRLLREFYGDENIKYPPFYRLSPDGNLVAAVAWDSEQYWWDLSTGERVQFPDSMWGPNVEFSNDGKLFAVDSSNGVDIWNLETKQIISTITGHSASIMCISFSPDKKLILTGSADRTVRLWNISTGELLRVFRGHTAAVTGVAFLPDGKGIVSTSMDKTIRTWITDYNDLIAYACTRVGRDLTQEERLYYGVSGQDATCPQFGIQSELLLPTTTPMLTTTPVLSWTPIPTPTP